VTKTVTSLKQSVLTITNYKFTFLHDMSGFVKEIGQLNKGEREVKMSMCAGTHVMREVGNGECGSR
jgi:hypothetical protein